MVNNITQKDETKGIKIVEPVIPIAVICGILRLYYIG